MDPGPSTSAAADPEFLTLEIWGAEDGQVTVHEQRGPTEVTLTHSGDTADVTTSGPGKLGRLEWPLIPGMEPPRHVVVNGQPWTLGDHDAGALVARRD